MIARNHRIRVITARKRVIAFVIEDSPRAALKLRRNARTKKFIAISAVTPRNRETFSIYF